MFHTHSYLTHFQSQGEMVQAKFGISGVAQYQLEIYTTAVLQATLKPPNPPRLQV